MKFEGLKEARSLLVIRDFRWLLISNPLMFAGLQIRNMAQSWLVLEETGSSIWLGFVAAAPAVGVVTLALYGGALADRGNRRTILFRSRIVLSILAFVTGFIVSSGYVEMWHLLVVGLGAGFAMALMGPAAQSMVMDVVGREKLMPALTLNNTLATGFSILGPALGGVYLAVFGLNSIFYVLGAVYLAAAVTIRFVKTNPKPIESKRLESGTEQIRQGLKYIWSTPKVRWMMIFSTTSIFVGGYPAVLPVLVREAWGIPEELREVAFGGVLATAGAGSITALLTLISIGNIKNKGRLMMLASTTITTGMLIIGLAANVYVAAVGAFFVGLAGAMFMTSVGTLIQASVEESMRGRVTSVFQMTVQLYAVGLVLGGLLTAWIGPNETILLFGVLIGSISTLTFWKSPELRTAE